MSGGSYLLDTNIVLYLLGGDKVVVEILDDKVPYVSYITEMELLSARKLTAEEDKKINSFLSDCTIIEMSREIKQLAIQIRKTTSLKLPDSIIAARASYRNITLLTADTEFNKLKSLSILQYKP